MTSIASNFSVFCDALIESSAKISTDNQGCWRVIPAFKRQLYSLECFEKRRLSSLAANMVKEFDRMEKVSVKFNGISEQSEQFKKYFEAASYIKNQMKIFSSSKKAGAQYQLLKQRVAALKYRIEQINGGLDKGEVSSEVTDELKQLAVEWKRSCLLYQDESLSKSEVDKLREASRYPKFAKLLKFDSAIRNQFFLWVIRDNNTVDTFVQFPSTCCRLKSALLSGRIGRFANNFRFLAKKNGVKEFRLPFQVELEDGRLKTKLVSILSESLQIKFRGGYQLAIREILNTFKRKNLNPGQLECFGSCGISNWHAHELGWWNPKTDTCERIDLDQENSEWWKQMPVFEHLSDEEVCRRFGIDSLQPGQWVAVAKSTRESLSLDIDRSHGYFEILVPNKDEGGYDLYPLGKFAREFPKNIIEKFLFVTNTVESRIEYPDENPFYSHRQHASAPFVLSEADGIALMEMIRKDLKAAREGNVVFQFAWENCAWWPQERLENLLGKKEKEAEAKAPNLFVSPLLESRPEVQPLKGILKICRALPEKLQMIAVKISAFILGSWRGVWVVEEGKRVFKSMKNSRFKKECKMYHPALLHERIQNGSVNGVVTMGHHFLPQYS
ncbi:putative uncharacterized protein [Waddlia chondrophila 2032/99]|uniref:Uncharacterized protein n=1 Tax=Waddlia chondrophila 2032/99 TaxID=765953 RepID=F8LCI1_9BACT|nr:putative uncharacterized protein [Waddlia chondrophila 2032/99]